MAYGVVLVILNLIETLNFQELLELNHVDYLHIVSHGF